ncbi:unnamed protein product, partial [Thlaspi arvense]
MRYELHSGQTKCISEDTHANSISVGKYFLVNPNEGHLLPDSHKITVKMKHEADNVEAGQFSFTAFETGTHYTCTSAVAHKSKTTLTVDFDWRSGVHSAHSKDWSKLAKKSQVEMAHRIYKTSRRGWSPILALENFLSEEETHLSSKRPIERSHRFEHTTEFIF